MRFKELLEYKRDITANNFGEKMADKLANDRSFTHILSREYNVLIGSLFHVDQNQGKPFTRIANDADSVTKIVNIALEVIEKKDPSPNKQYVQWVVMRYIDGGISRFEDILTTIETLLRKYHELKVHRALPAEMSDIGRYKTKQDLIKLWNDVNLHHQALETKLQRADDEALPKGNAKVVFDNEEMRVIIPQDKQAACYYGQGTQWCTASTSSANYFDHYNNDGPLYIIIPKNAHHEGEKYQLHFESNQHMNENDGAISIVSLFKSRFKEQSSFDFFNEKGGLSSYISFADATVFNDIVKAIKDQVKDYLYEEMFEWESSDDYYYEWLHDGGYWNEEEDMPSDDAPSYLDYNTEAGRLFNDVLDEVDVSQDDADDWDQQWEDDEVYTLADMPYVVASILRDGEERNSSFRGTIAEEIEKNLSVTLRGGKAGKPEGWTLSHEWKSVVDGKTKWNKSAVAEKNYVN
jgi:hypothetical protein